jgi:enoyl-CoA hydratase
VNDVVTRVEGKVGRIRLNRPKAIHALTREMCSDMIAALVPWREDPAVQAVMIDHAEGRGFCAGGDVVMLARSGAGDGAEARAFFHEEYRLNHLLFTYAKPTVAFMDGITMGGGVGISQPCRFRVATENTRFAMPETAIGLFPDVGGGWYLPRLPGRSGQFLALTGARLDGAECLALGLATHYVPSLALDDLKAQILAEPERIEALLEENSATPPPARIEANFERIDRLFASDDYEEILAALEADGSDWARRELETLRTKSPQACKVSLRLLYDGARPRDAPGICGRHQGRAAPRFRRGGASLAGRQGQQPALGAADPPRRHPALDRHHLRADARGRGMDAIVTPRVGVPAGK